MATLYEIREIEREIEEVSEDIKVLRRLLDKATTRRHNLELKLIVNRKRVGLNTNDPQ